MDSTNDDFKRLAEYFVICGLPKNPKTYDISKILTHAEEIIAPDTYIDFTRFSEPIDDIIIVSSKDNVKIPHGYTPLNLSFYGKQKAQISINFREEATIYYHRGRLYSPIVSVGVIFDKLTRKPKPLATVLKVTFGGRKANISSVFTNNMYLTYVRASPNVGVDSLAVTDLCIISSWKDESCPPAYSKVSDPISLYSLGQKAYLCYRKSLVKQYIISYEPEVLFWYRVPDAPPDVKPIQSDRNSNQSFIEVQSANDLCSIDFQTIEEADEQIQPLDADICQVANFCLPWGASIESWSVDQCPPKCSTFTFMLTNEAYQRLYGVAFTFYEPYDLSQLDIDKCYRLSIDPELLPVDQSSNSTVDDSNAEQVILDRQRHFIQSRIEDRIIGVTKTICLLSRWSFTSAFMNYLSFLYGRCLELVNSRDWIPFERYLGHLLFQVQFPNISTPNILLELCAAPILFQCPDNFDNSANCEAFFCLLSKLGVELSLQLLVQMLTEQKLLMSSVRHDVLSSIGEALTSMIFPLKWTVVYIPYIYMGCIHVIQSPSPYLIGMDSRFFDFFRLPFGSASGIAYLDVDTKNFIPVRNPGQTALDTKLLPKKPLKQLRNTLTVLYEEMEAFSRSILKSQEPNRSMIDDCFLTKSNSEMGKQQLTNIRSMWINELTKMNELGYRIKMAFFDFMVYLLRHYRSCLYSREQMKDDKLFDTTLFLKERAESYTIPFYQALFDTQQWGNFVRDRSYPSPCDDEFHYFDDCIERLNENESQFLFASMKALIRGSVSSKMDSGGASGSGGDGSDHRLSIDVVDGYLAHKQQVAKSMQPFYINRISPPSWPIVDWITLSSNNWSFCQTAGKFPNRLNSHLLDQLYFWSIQSSTGLNNLIGSPLVLSKNQLLNGPSASMQTCSMVGLGTKFPVPMKNVNILKRSLQELKQSVLYAAAMQKRGGIDLAKYTISTAYALWFMLLPANLACFYSLMRQSDQADEESTANLSFENMEKLWLMAFGVYTRSIHAGFCVPDNVIQRILLVLLYQHRFGSINLPSFANSVNWNDYSTPLVNYIYKSFNKEQQELEHLRRVHQCPTVPSCSVPSLSKCTDKQCSNGQSYKRYTEQKNSNFVFKPPLSPLIQKEIHQSVVRQKSSSLKEVGTVTPSRSNPLNSSFLFDTSVKRCAPLASTDDLTDDLGYSTMDVHPNSAALRSGQQHCNNRSMVADATKADAHKLDRRLDASSGRSNSVGSYQQSETLRQQQPLYYAHYNFLRQRITAFSNYVTSGSNYDTTKSSGDSSDHRSCSTHSSSSSSNSDGRQSYFGPATHPNIHDSVCSEGPGDSGGVGGCEHSAYSGLGDSHVQRNSVPYINNAWKILNQSTSDLSSKIMNLSIGSWFASSNPATAPNDNLSTTACSIDHKQDYYHDHAKSNHVINPNYMKLVHSEQIQRVPWAIRRDNPLASPNVVAQTSSSSSVKELNRLYSSTERVFQSSSMLIQPLLSHSSESQPSSTIEQLKCHTNVCSFVAGSLCSNKSFKERFHWGNWQSIWHNRATGVSQCRQSSVVDNNGRYSLSCSHSRSNVNVNQNDDNLRRQSSATTSGVHSLSLDNMDPLSSSLSSSLLLNGGLHESRVTRISVCLSTLTTCPHCNRLVYDEEIMAGWSANIADNENETQCPKCDLSFVPQLFVKIFAEVLRSSSLSPTNNKAEGEFRQSRVDSGGGLSNAPTYVGHRSPLSSPNTSRRPSSTNKHLMEKTFAYLNPFVLRNQLEHIIQFDQMADECLRTYPMDSSGSLLGRHEQLAWNLVWLFGRLGLPTHILDCLPHWLIQWQNELRSKCLNSDEVTGDSGSRSSIRDPHFTDAFYQIKLSLNLPVLVFLRWNAHQIQSSVKNPLYKHWNMINTQLKGSAQTPWSLVPASPQNTMKVHPTESPTSACPIYDELSNLIGDLVDYNVHAALTSLILLKRSLEHKQSLTTNSGHRCITAIEGSMYRQLVFLAKNVMDELDLVQFDQRYKDAVAAITVSGLSKLPSDEPSFLAAAYRQMLNKLVLIP